MSTNNIFYPLQENQYTLEKRATLREYILQEMLPNELQENNLPSL